MYERDDYVLDAELPGQNVVTSRLSTQAWSWRSVGSEGSAPCVEESYHRPEGHRGRFHRTFLLPEPVEQGRISLDLNDGIPHLVLCKDGSQPSGGIR